MTTLLHQMQGELKIILIIIDRILLLPTLTFFSSTLSAFTIGSFLQEMNALSYIEEFVIDRVK